MHSYAERLPVESKIDLFHFAGKVDNLNEHIFIRHIIRDNIKRIFKNGVILSEYQYVRRKEKHDCQVANQPSIHHRAKRSVAPFIKRSKAKRRGERIKAKR